MTKNSEKTFIPDKDEELDYMAPIWQAANYDAYKAIEKTTLDASNHYAWTN